AASGWAVQAGAWPELSGAEQAARRLTSAGAPQIRLIRQGGAVVYQVIIAAPDEPAATALQSLVVTRGFSGAQVLRP
ncbi:MAG: SPOR domain-containing protein, partial [Alphaproteobacteria bacterium]